MESVSFMSIDSQIKSVEKNGTKPVGTEIEKII